MIKHKWTWNYYFHQWERADQERLLFLHYSHKDDCGSVLYGDVKGFNQFIEDRILCDVPYKHLIT